MRLNALFAAAFLLAGSPALAAPQVPTGVWMTEKDKARIEITDCAGAPCGVLVGLKKPDDKDGRPKLDEDNPDPALRTRPLIGVALISGMVPDGEDGWRGKVYNPDDGGTYVGRLIVEGPDTLRLKGCIVGGLLCKTETLTRAR